MIFGRSLWVWGTSWQGCFLSVCPQNRELKFVLFVFKVPPQMVLCRQVLSKFRWPKATSSKHRSSSSVACISSPSSIPELAACSHFAVPCPVKPNEMASSAWRFKCLKLADLLVKMSRRCKIFTEGKAKGQKWPLFFFFFAVFAVYSS